MDKALRRITEHIPEDLVGKFAQESGITREDIHPIPPGRSGMVTAVDGSNTMVLEGGSVCHRRNPGSADNVSQQRTPSTAPSPPSRSSPSGRGTGTGTLTSSTRTVSASRPTRDWTMPIPSGHPPSSATRWSTGSPCRPSRTLPAGALLLLDGALRVSSQNHEPVLAEIITTAQERNVLLAAVAKRTRVTWGGGHPLLPAIGGLVAHLGISGPWWAKVDEHLPDHTEYRQGRHGELYIASLHSRVSRPMKMDLPKGTGEETAAATMQALAACADDGRIPGYPYPLLDAHRTCLIDEPLVTQIQQDIKAGLAKQGMQNRTFEDLFGDLHGEFERY